VKRREWIERGLDLGLPAAPSARDRNISLFSRGMDPQFSRGMDPQFAGISTFARMPYVEDMRSISPYDVAVVGVPFDMGTTYRSGIVARFPRLG
jgi:agmatinase